ncbi:MAG: hypothetical protein ACRDPO_24615, partial [Streptosporangiaceae bacterium]
RVRRRLGGRLAEPVGAGRTHQGDGDAGLFSAPQRIADRAAELGWPELERRFSLELRRFTRSATWLAVDRAHGLEGAARVYQQTLADATAPGHAQVVELAHSEPGALGPAAAGGGLHDPGNRSAIVADGCPGSRTTPSARAGERAWAVAEVARGPCGARVATRRSAAGLSRDPAVVGVPLVTLLCT